MYQNPEEVGSNVSEIIEFFSYSEGKQTNRPGFLLPCLYIGVAQIKYGFFPPQRFRIESFQLVSLFQLV